MAAKERAGAEVRRVLAVLYVDAEADERTIQSFTQLSRRQAFAIRKSYLATGTEALRDKRLSNRDRVLTKAERNTVLAALKSRQPKDLIDSCPDEHWSTYWLGRYIEALTGKRYKSKTSHHLLFREAKLSFHLPGKRYEKADQDMVDVWVAQQSDGRSRLMRAWHDPDTVVLCADEMVLTSGTTLQKVWLPKGQYPPVIETNSTRKRKSAYGFLNLKTGQQHTYVTDWQNMYITVEVLEQLRQVYPTQQLLIVWDNCGWHRGSEVMKWAGRDKRTKLLFFPAYAPELNPQEHVWKAGRGAVTHNKHITDIGQAAEDFRAYVTGRTFDYGLCGLRPHQAGAV